MLRKMLFAVSALALMIGPSVAWSADSPSPTSPSATGNPGSPGVSASPSPYQATTPMAQTPPADWTSLKGMVQVVDAQAKTVQIKDDTGNLLQVPVDRHVQILKDGKAVQLSQIQTGDSITLSKKSST